MEKVLGEFICRFFGVNCLADVQIYGPNAIPAFSVMREQTSVVRISTNAQFNMDQSPELQCITCYLNDPKMPTIPVQICNVTVTHQRQNMGIPIAVRLNWDNEHMAAMQGTRDTDDAFSAAGGIRGEFARFLPTGERGEDRKDVPLPDTMFGPQSKPFIRTMSLITEQNLRNGIVEIPHQVCAEANLPVWTGDLKDPDDAFVEQMMKRDNIDSANKVDWIRTFKAQQLETINKDAEKITHWYAIPFNHVLSWGLHSDEFAKSRRFTRLIMSRHSGPMYFLVPNDAFRCIWTEFCSTWLGKVDSRPLRACAFQFLPHLRGQNCTGLIEMRAWVSYFVAPDNVDIQKLAPVLAPDFPPVHLWSNFEMEKQEALAQWHTQHMNQGRAKNIKHV